MNWHAKIAVKLLENGSQTTIFPFADPDIHPQLAFTFGIFAKIIMNFELKFLENGAYTKHEFLICFRYIYELLVTGFVTILAMVGLGAQKPSKSCYLTTLAVESCLLQVSSCPMLSDSQQTRVLHTSTGTYQDRQNINHYNPP